jgi:RNA polymerase sigma-70 factor, ECF subfamily
MTLDLTTRSAILDAMPQLRAVALSLCRDRDRANDLTQEALLRACVNIDKFKPGSNMLAWLITIMRHQYYSEYRRRCWWVEDADGSYAESLLSEPDQIACLEHQDLCAALAELPKDLRRALMLVAVDGLSYEEAGRTCNCSVGTVKSRVHRARERLAAKLSMDRKMPRTALRSAGAHARDAVNAIDALPRPPAPARPAVAVEAWR